MNRFKAHGLTLLAISVMAMIGAQAASAALPAFSLPSGEEFPVLGEAVSHSDPHSVKLEEQLGFTYYAEQVAARLEIGGTGPSASLELEFTNVKEGKATCQAEGEVEGHLKLTGELRLVPTNKEGSKTGALITFRETTLVCIEGGKEVVKRKIKGPMIAAVAATTLSGAEEPVTSFSLIARCSGMGTQELSTYFNDEGNPVEKQLIKSGSIVACMEFREELPVYLNKAVVMPTTVVDLELPFIELLPRSEKYPIVLGGGGSTIETKVESPSGLGFVTGELNYSIEVPRPGPSGLISIRLTHTKEKTFSTACKTEGASAEEVVIKGEYRLVPISTATVGLLITFPELAVKCSRTFKIKGPLILGVEVPLGRSISAFGIVAQCKEVGKQKLTSYFNDEKKLVEKQLIIWQQLELPLEYACLSTGSEVTVNAANEFVVYE